MIGEKAKCLIKNNQAIQACIVRHGIAFSSFVGHRWANTPDDLHCQCVFIYSVGELFFAVFVICAKKWLRTRVVGSPVLTIRRD